MIAISAEKSAKKTPACLAGGESFL